MSAYTIRTIQEQALEDLRAAFEAGRRENQIAEAREEINAAFNRAIAETRADFAALQASLNELTARLHAGMDAIAAQVGAFRCDFCGEYKVGTKVTTLAHTTCVDCLKEEAEAEEINAEFTCWDCDVPLAKRDTPAPIFCDACADIRERQRKGVA